MRKLPSFFSLRAFEAAARLQSFALASEELHLSPSAISHQVRGLETYFGKSLFTRSFRRVELTADGRRLLDKLSVAFDLMEAACEELGPARRSDALAVHCSPSFAAKWLGPRLPRFMQQYPDINISMSSGAEPMDLLRHEELDLTIAYGNAPTRAGIVSEAIGSETIVPLCSPALLHDRAVPALTDIAAMTLIQSTLNPVRWSDWFALNGMKLPPGRPMPSFDRASLALAAAVNQVGIALESTRLAEQEIANGELVPLSGGTLKSVWRETHFLSYREAEKNSKNIVRFRDWLFSQAGLHQQNQATGS
ncbi:LysR family transcriptional regulator [Herbaspirillum sp. meg3]|uniref:LysR substrate-binding domain-containing protein n=1 Tax=Herbaspirillum sp. meg3 TaxID=2025949 RepID=UPI000B994E01|nr:LysR substrate-binding domain-containing protein [Herbaspirillum sp. meg3]ASU38750.1 LysR family transcriptional regulator [Herbaspirillum sp. meg3]